MIDLWENAKQLSIRTGSRIVGGFDIGFDRRIPKETVDELMGFAYWVEDRYAMPITLWVDFQYKHYLLDPDRKRVAYRFYRVDYESLESFDRFEDIPVIELAVRCEKRSMDAVLFSFTEALTCYFAWLSGEKMDTFRPDPQLAEEILQLYKMR